MSITLTLEKISTESELLFIIKLSKADNYYKILKNVNPKLITIDLVENLLDLDLVKIDKSDKFFQALIKLVKEGYQDDSIQKSVSFLYEKNCVKIQDKYLSYIEDEINLLKGKNKWNDTISKVLSEITGDYESEMEKEIKEIYNKIEDD